MTSLVLLLGPFLCLTTRPDADVGVFAHEQIANEVMCIADGQYATIMLDDLLIVDASNSDEENQSAEYAVVL